MASGSAADSNSTFTSGSVPASASIDTLDELRELTRAFAAERDWGQFHTPKNLAMALSVEVAELAEHFQWLRTGELDELDERKLDGIRHEMADVLLYLVQLADRTGVDLRAAALEKLRMNGEKYPAEKVKGDARKYDEY
ncbi:nucleotide pyrophosphohydrolase [Massilia dura]|uniref:Nucleotide pyrophosphohydrolase n=1 Tax=Pseudoduganella dura TaxID=321982 RepID=A0A6I3X7V1_9BURK|nr:nucleotide pyrophosphohydrolase [Pseudoduganella dura]MUI12854.1 nucleotide pyrophosphohydrolase [Pseudoduganella dura]